LTKNELTDASLKCHVDIEETVKVNLGNIQKLLEKNPSVLHSLENVPSPRPKHNVETTLKARSRLSNMSKATKKLYDLEPVGESEKSVKIDLDLYQMEDF